MKRLWAVLLAATALAGCRSAQPATNPFLRTTVPPPATGQAVVIPGEPFTPGVVPQPAPPIVAPAVPVGPPPAAPPPMVAPPKDKFSPPGGSFQYNQSSIERSAPPTQTNPVKLAAYSPPVSQQPRAAVSTLTASQPPQATTPAVKSGTPGNEIRILPPRPKDSREAIAAREAAASSSSPAALHVTADDGQSRATSSSAFRKADRDTPSRRETQVAIVTPETMSQATGGDDEQDGEDNVEEPADGEADSKPADQAGYAFAADYGWLRGRLEYSQSMRQWKLRYIPIDGQTDPYGGSVKFSSSADLSAFKPGDMVAVRGSVATGSSTSGSYAPLYELAQIESAMR